MFKISEKQCKRCGSKPTVRYSACNRCVSCNRARNREYYHKRKEAQMNKMDHSCKYLSADHPAWKPEYLAPFLCDGMASKMTPVAGDMILHLFEFHYEQFHNLYLKICEVDKSNCKPLLNFDIWETLVVSAAENAVCEGVE